MKKFTLFLLALATSGALVSCGDDDKKSEDPKPKSRAELLMAKSWMITGETETEGSTTKNVLSDNYDTCELDDSFKFLAGNILTYDQGTVKCDSDEPRTISGNWTLSENDTKLTYTVLFFGAEYKIEELTENKFVLSTVQGSGNKAVTTKTTYTGK